MSLQQFIERLLPRETHFYTFLENQAVVALKAAEAFLPAGQPGADYETVRSELKKLENEGDRIHDEMMSALAATFVTPIDREDLQRLSKRLDDITDLLDVSARAFLVFHVDGPTEAIGALIRLIHESCKVLAEVMPLLRRSKYNELIERCRALARLEKQGNQIFRDELSRLFRDPAVDAKEILRAREVLDHLEKALDKCRLAAQTLTNIAVKHA